MSLGELERGDDFASRTLYKLLSFASGQELAETERQKLRQNRKEVLDKYFGPSTSSELRSEELMEVVIDMGLKEAELIDSFEPDLLVTTPQQYKLLFDIPAGVGIAPTYDPIRGNIDHEPPMWYEADAGGIDVTYSDSARGMLLVESDSL